MPVDTRITIQSLCEFSMTGEAVPVQKKIFSLMMPIDVWNMENVMTVSILSVTVKSHKHTRKYIQEMQKQIAPNRQKKKKDAYICEKYSLKLSAATFMQSKP
jgi:hypothetical protein